MHSLVLTIIHFDALQRWRFSERRRFHFRPRHLLLLSRLVCVSVAELRRRRRSAPAALGQRPLKTTGALLCPPFAVFVAPHRNPDAPACTDRFALSAPHAAPAVAVR